VAKRDFIAVRSSQWQNPEQESVGSGYFQRQDLLPSEQRMCVSEGNIGTLCEAQSVLNMQTHTFNCQGTTFRNIVHKTYRIQGHEFDDEKRQREQLDLARISSLKTAIVRIMKSKKILKFMVSAE
jgi:hypothetical protein